MSVLEDRMVGKLTVTVVRVAGLKNVAAFGNMHPQVSISINSDKKYTRTIEDAGNSAEFGETLSFNLDCQPTDLVHIKAKHDSNFVDTTIGIFSLSVGDFVKQPGKTLKMLLVDEEDFSASGTVELIVVYEGTNAPIPSLI